MLGETCLSFQSLYSRVVETERVLGFFCVFLGFGFFRRKYPPKIIVVAKNFRDIPKILAAPSHFNSIKVGAK